MGTMLYFKTKYELHTALTELIHLARQLGADDAAVISATDISINGKNSGWRLQIPL